MTGANAVPAVMGRSAALTTTTLLAAVGLAQLLGFRVSGVIDRASSSAWLGTVWGVAFLLAGILISAAWFTRDAFLAMVFEIAASICTIAGLAFYVGALFAENHGWPSNGAVTLALATAAIANFGGRGFHLATSIMRWIVLFQPGSRAAHASTRILRRVTRR